jgi:biopolymer transport protein ExbD
MGGAAPVESGKSKKKSLDMELNLVPFIDLLSCLISFLLITAVWTQISTLKVHQQGNVAPEDNPDPPPGTIDVRLTLTDRGYLLSLAGNPVELPKVARQDGSGMGFDTKTLVEKLKLVKQSYPEQHAVTVASEDAVSFEDLTNTIDNINSAELPDVTVTAAVN